MKEIYFFLGVASLGCAVYHLGQKAIPASVNPMVMLAGVYLAALLMACAAAPFFRRPGQVIEFRQVICWPVFFVGVGVILIEGGFLLAYRYGGSLQWSGVAVNGAAAIVLVPLAVFAFREHFSFARISGVLLTLGGMVLMARK